MKQNISQVATDDPTIKKSVRKPNISVADVPHMLKMWDRERNKEQPEYVSTHCPNPKYWSCPDCGYEWSTSPKARYRSSGKCPCHESNKAIKRGVNDILTLVKRLDSFLDEDNDFEAIYKEGLDSKLPVNFKCDECGRKWNAILKSQVKKDGNGGYFASGCPHYETSKRKKDEVPFCTEVESIIRFWDPNNPMDPAKTRSNSTESAHFICKNCGYDWTTSICSQARGTGKCKCCELQRVTRKGFTDVFTLVPESKRFFNFKKNKDIDIYSIPLSDKETLIDWKCPDCQREWRSYMHYRIKGKKDHYSFVGCRDCYHSKIHITPVAARPDLIKYWDFKKNRARGLDPNLTSAFSDEPADWKCKDCGYEWTVNIRSRSNSDGKCPHCNGYAKRIMTGVNDMLTLCPDLTRIYDFDTNEKASIDIYKEGISSQKECHFKCQKCGYEWVSRLRDRIEKLEDGTYRIVDCPECSSLRLRKTPYSVEFPLLAKMYRNDMNMTPLDSIRGLNGIKKTYYHWECLECREIFSSTLISMIMSYDYSTHGCPYCSRTKLRPGESFADLHPELMDEYDPANTIDPYQVFPNNGEKAGWICRDCGHHWDATFALRHTGGGICPVCNRTMVVPDKNSFAAVYPDYVKYWADSNERKADEVFYNASIWINFICPICGEEHSAHIEDFINGESCSYCKGTRLSPEVNSLKVLYPESARRWSPNNDFGPETVLPTSWAWAKWICDTCTGEYNARVKDVVNGEDECPYCNGTKVLPGFNSFGDKHPDLVAEMDEIANYLLPKTPFDVLDTSDYKFWFICKKDPKHKYPMSPRDRLMFQKRGRESCLYCRGQRRKMHHFVIQ